MMERPYTNLAVWQNTIQFVKLIYAVTSTFAPEEKEGLARKLRNRVTDIPVLLASGISNGIQPGSQDYILKAAAAMQEIETLLLVCVQLGILQQKEFSQYEDDMLKINQELHHLANRIEKKFK